MHVRAAFEEGACGAMAFAWTDEWWRGGHSGRRLGDSGWSTRSASRSRRSRPWRRAFAEAPFAADERRRWPKVSVVVCAYNAADTIDECLASLTRLTYPDVDMIVVNDGSRDRHRRDRVRGIPRVRVIDIAERRSERGPQRRPRRRDRRDRRLYRRRRAGRSRLADLSGAADSRVRRGRRRRTRTSCRRTIRGWRSAWRARRADRRTCCSTIASPSTSRAATWRSAARRCWRSAASTRLPARRRRRRYLLAAAGAGLRIGFAPSALVWHHHRSSVSALLATAGRLRRGRDMARRPSSREVRRAARCCGAAHLQPASLPAVVDPSPREHRHVGHGGVPGRVRAAQ